MGCSCSKQEEMYHTCTPRFTLLRKSLQPYNFNYSKSSSYTALRYKDLPGARFPIRVQNILRYTDLCCENLEPHDFMMTLEYFVVVFPMGRDSATFRDKGTEVPSLSRDKGTTGQAQNLAKGQPVKIQDGTQDGTRFWQLSRPTGQNGTEQKRTF